MSSKDGSGIFPLELTTKLATALIAIATIFCRDYFLDTIPLVNIAFKIKTFITVQHCTIYLFLTI